MNNDQITVVKVRGVLMVILPSDPDDSSIQSLQDRAMAGLEQHDSKALIMDISAVEIFDSFFARAISETAQMATLMGARTIIAGMRPAVAITATQLGLALKCVETALTTDQALAMVDLGRKRGWRK